MTNTRRSPAAIVTLTLLMSLSALAGCKSGGGSAGDSGAPATVPANDQSSSGSASPSTANSAPTISGVAAPTIAAQSSYSFAPSAQDADGDQLTFQIQNKPSWATFSTVTGQLTGTPTTSQVGTYANVVITASDGKLSTSLPAFSITVSTTAQPTLAAATLQWTAPTQNTDGTQLTNLAGFVIVYGTSSTALSNSVRIENASVDRYVLENMAPGTYYFGVKAYTTAGVDSDVSTTVSKKIG